MPALYKVLKSFTHFLNCLLLLLELVVSGQSTPNDDLGLGLGLGGKIYVGGAYVCVGVLKLICLNLSEAHWKIFTFSSVSFYKVNIMCKSKFIHVILNLIFQADL